MLVITLAGDGDDAYPTARHTTPGGPVRAIVLTPRLGPRAGPPRRSDPRPRPPHGGGGLAGDGPGAGAALRALPSGAEPRELVQPDRQPRPARPAGGGPGAPRPAAGGTRRDAGAAAGGEDCRQGDLPRRGPLQPRALREG